MPSLNPFEHRTAGILLHPTSLPAAESYWQGNAENAFGTLGKEAYNFVDFMVAAGLTLWQVLPLVPTEDNLSPYQSTSVHAGNPDLISWDDIVARGWVQQSCLKLSEHNRPGLAQMRRACAVEFFKFLESEAGRETRQKFENFCQDEAVWLNDFALFSALRIQFNGSSWVDWPEELRKRNEHSLETKRSELQEEINSILFEQFCFYTQWLALKNYANEKGIQILGDIPIFVGHNSADVWAEQQYFLLDDHGQPKSMAGVPPDSFSADGQCWGNPHYNWEAMEKDGFKWWLARFGSQMKLFDLIRIDHFRGFHSVWAIPGGSPDAREGEWVNTPGDALLQACFEKYPDLKLVAENLGSITPDIEELRLKFNLPGMIVLHFAFEDDSNSPHLPHFHTAQNIVYTGTHDNDTTLGWFNQLNEKARKQFAAYSFHSGDSMPWLLIDMALASGANVAIIPMQDFLSLDSSCRMNMPGTPDKNWRWRFSWDQVDMGLANTIKERLANYHRLVIAE